MSGHHNHNHSHQLQDLASRAFAIGVALNVLIVVIQVIFGYLAHSMALLADAGHNFGDVLGLILAWGAHQLKATKPNHRFSYGLKSSSILAAFLNAIILLIATGAIVWESFERVRSPSEVNGLLVVYAALAGVAVNGLSAVLFLKQRKSDLNIRAAFIHLVGDALVSVGVVVSGLLVTRTGWLWLDPLTSLVICGLIGFSTWGLFRESLGLALHGVPASIDAREVRKYLSTLDGVTEVHDLHIWGMSTSENALTCHMVIDKRENSDTDFIEKVAHGLEERFGIHHATIQVESEPCHWSCAQ